jgi:phenylacetate-CoA ligase
MSLRTRSFDAKVGLLGGRAYADFAREAREAERSDAATLARRQTRAAAGLVRYAAEEAPWYRERLSPDVLRGLEQPGGFDAVPVLEKSDLRENFDALRAAGAGRRKAVVARTGGSTGEPLTVLKDFTIRPAALQWRLMQWWGVHPADDAALLERSPYSGWRQRAQDLVWWPTRRAHLDAASMSEDDVRRFVARLRAVRPRVLFGYAGALHELALTVRREGWQLDPVPVIASTAAPLTPVQVADIEQVLGGTVHDVYRSAELSLVAGQCEHRAGLHVQSDHKLLEVVDAEGRRVPDGTPGEVVVTDLLNRVQPLVRYRLGDVAVMDPEPCVCGRPFPVLRTLAGRSNDVLRTPSGRVSFYTFAGKFTDQGTVRQYQIHQLEDFSLLVKIVPASDAVRLADLRDALDHLADELHGEVQVRAELVAQIPHVRGKHKTVVSHLADSGAAS